MKQISNECADCLRNKNRTPVYGIISGYLNSNAPLSKLCVDILGPLKGHNFTDCKNTAKINLLVVVDVFSRWTEIGHLKKSTAVDVVETFRRIWLSKFITPTVIISDQGPLFISETWKDFYSENGIFCKTTSVYNPTGNSPVEHKNSQIATSLRIYKKEGLREAIKKAKQRINYTSNVRLRLAPAKILECRSDLDLLNRNLLPQVETLVDADKQNKERKLQINNSLRKALELDNVKTVMRKNHSSDKLSERWKGPFELVEHGNDGNTVKINEGTKVTTQNIKNILPVKLGEDDMR